MVFHPLHQHLLLMPTFTYSTVVTVLVFPMFDIPELSPCLRNQLVEGILLVCSYL